MKEFQYIIKDEMGIHARPAGELVKAASAFPCDIRLALNGREADAKRIMAVMSLGAKRGAELTVRTDGDREDEAAAALLKFLEENL
ncbi:MAG: HPr family phosphocarrier protein [Lachnospiraceae bacterium]|nr:HPr family phosphocarrier protein [Lachnospiraceae bacterium]